MFLTDLPRCQQIALVTGMALGGISIGLELRHKTGWAFAILTLAALVLRVSAAFLDPFLNTWDEVFHAVVARNMMDHPFLPMRMMILHQPRTAAA